MRSWMNLVFTSALMLAVVGCAHFTGPRHRASAPQAQTMPHAGDAAVRIETRNGSVHLAAQADAEVVTVNADLTCVGDTQAEADQRLAESSLSVARDDGRLVIKPVFAGGPRSGDGASISVFVPSAAGVEIDTSNGAVSVRGLAGTLVVETSNGAINIMDHRGDATMDTSNAQVIVKNHDGGAMIDTSNGAVHVEGMIGRLQVDTSNAAVRVRDLNGAAVIDSSNGSIDLVLADDAPGPVRLGTSNAPISVTVGGTFAGSIAMKTTNASVSVKDPGARAISKQLKKSSGEVTLGQGGEPSVIETSNGSITVVVNAS